VNNWQYRQSRDTDYEFCATEEEVLAEWYRINKEKIDRRRECDKARKRYSRKRTPWADSALEEGD
jgi:hypothetical protein